MTKKLTLIDRKLVNFKDGGKRVKHTFIDSLGNPFTGWTEESDQELSGVVSQTGQYDETIAREREIEVSEFDQKLRYRVVLP